MTRLYASGCSWVFILALTATPAFAQNHDRALANKLPDMGKYDCAQATSPPAGATVTTMHIGQVIKGRFVEWNEYYLTTADQPGERRLICVSHIAPKARQLNAADAKSFLTDSMAVGAPTEAAKKSLAAPQLVTPEDAKVEPLKRKRGSSTNKSGALSTSPDEAPPVPVTRSADPNSPDNTPASKPHASNTTTLFSQDSSDDGAGAVVASQDTRVQVTDTTAYPSNTIGFLVVTYPNGESFRCSGTLVSPYTVLTAGHCLHNNNRGGFVAQVAFYPGQYQPSGSTRVVRPFGGHNDWQNLKATQQWMQISGDDSYPVSSYQSDFAAVQFRTPFTHTATFMPVVYSSTVSPVTSTGYPGVVNSVSTQTAWTTSGPERATSLRNSHVREFTLTSSGGNSGGPFFVTDAGTNRSILVGSLSFGDDTNTIAGGPWYDNWNQALLKDWMSFNVTTTAVAQNSSSGLRIASVFSSAQSQTLSFVRLYNPGPSAGTVNITLADYATGTLLTTWTSPSIAAGASVQYAVADMERNGTTRITAAPAFYSLSIRPTFNGYFQHVLWQPQDGSLTDITTCDTKTTTDPYLLLNVHSTSIPPGYPSSVIVENTGSTPVAVTLGIYDSRNGQRLGGVTTGQIAANAQNITTMISLQNAAGIAAPADMTHFNVKSETTFTGYLQHLVRNERSGVITDMTPVCVMNP